MPKRYTQRCVIPKAIPQGCKAGITSAGMPLAARFGAMHQVDDVSDMVKMLTKSSTEQAVYECKNSKNLCSF